MAKLARSVKLVDAQRPGRFVYDGGRRPGIGRDRSTGVSPRPEMFTSGVVGSHFKLGL
jgi:hypothetical protein